MKKLLLAAIAALALTSCQKDYYLSDLNKANSEIESLKSKINSLETEIVSNAEVFVEEANRLNRTISELRDFVRILEDTIEEREYMIEDLQIKVEDLEDEIEELLFDPSAVGEMEGFKIETLADWNELKNNIPKNNTIRVKGDIFIGLNHSIIGSEISPFMNKIVKIDGCIDFDGASPNWFDFEKLEYIGCGVNVGDGIKVRFFNGSLNSTDEITPQSSNRIYVNGSNASYYFGSKWITANIFIPSNITEYNIEIRYGTPGTSCYNVCGIGDSDFSERKWMHREINISSQNDSRKLIKISYKINGSIRYAKEIQVDF